MTPSEKRDVHPPLTMPNRRSDPTGKSLLAFSLKVVFFGLVGIFIVTCLPPFSDDNLKQTLMIGNHFPVTVFFLLLVLGVIWNPLVRSILPVLLRIIGIPLLILVFGLFWCLGALLWNLFVLAGQKEAGWFKTTVAFVASTGHRISTAIIDAFNWICDDFLPGCELQPKELVLFLALTLTACWVPTSGLYRYFHRQLIVPWIHRDNKPAWREYQILERLPAKLFPAPRNREIPKDPAGARAWREEEKRVYGGFQTGLAKGDQLIGLLDLPLRAWLRPMALYWGPLLFSFAVATVGLSLLVHRQWAHYEQLSYPLATIANSLIQREEGRSYAQVFYSKMFWVAFAIVFGIQGLRLLSAWYPLHVPMIHLRWNFDFYNTFPILKQSGMPAVSHGTLLFAVIGITYFLSSEIGFTVGISQLLLTLVMVQFYTTTGQRLGDTQMEISRGGAYVGYALILLYTGRSYYGAILKAALGLVPPRPDQEDAIWAARVAAIGFLGFVIMLVLMGLDWLVALVFSLFTFLLFLVFTRIVCESGIFFLQAGWWPGTLMTRLFGGAAIGPTPLVFIHWLHTILAQDPRECLMPYVATSLKVADDYRMRLTRIMQYILGGLFVALTVGFLAKAWQIYQYGAAEDDWAYNRVATLPFDQAQRAIELLKDTGLLEKAETAFGFQKLTLLSAGFDREVLGFFFSGMIGVFLFSILRFRYSGWPLHPVLFLIWGTYPIGQMAQCFLIGWAIKALIVKFGGGKVYQELKPIFLGLILGELAVVALSIVIGFGYFAWEGMLPRIPFYVYPG